MHIAMHIGEFQAMHYKRFQKATSGTAIPNRPRPSQLSPALMPPIAVPAHASYPSGHSTQAHLLSGLLTQVMPTAVTYQLHNLPGAPQANGSLLDRLAERVARNREVLGLHYRSDSAAGKSLAEKSLLLLLQCPSVQTIVNAARTEWQ